jgi:DNA polymerase-1
MRPLLIVDGDNLAHRAYHSMPKSVTGTGGVGINAIVGFFSMLTNLWQREQPRGVYVAWDTLGVDTYRNKLWPPYQTGRVFEPSIVQQLGLLPTICEACCFGVGKEAGYEADDLIAAAANAELVNGGKCLIYTTDRDAYQLVSENVTVISPKRGSNEPDRIRPEDVVARLGVLPEQVVDFKALCGDPSDRIPGAKGIGVKSAAALLAKHGTLDAVLESWASQDEAKQILTFREIVRMRADADVSLPERAPDWECGAAALEGLGAQALAKRLRSLAV